MAVRFARSEINTVAINVVEINNDVADVYSNPGLDTRRRLFGHSFLHFLLRSNVSR